MNKQEIIENILKEIKNGKFNTDYEFIINYLRYNRFDKFTREYLLYKYQNDENKRKLFEI